MKNVKTVMEDDLRPEYDLRSLCVRKVGSGRNKFSESIRLEPDVAEVFQDTESVNEALRFLIRITRENKSTLFIRKNKRVGIKP
mgnify:FL=1